MCGRFVMTHPDEAIAALFDAVVSNDLPPSPRYNICPTQPVAVVTSEGGARRLRPMRWGFLPGWYKSPKDGPLLINARADTIATKPAFRAAVRARRCLIPASGFYEWSAGDNAARLPWYIRRVDGQPLAFAGIWQAWEREGQALVTFAIVTTESGDAVAKVHHREPVTVERADWPLWLGEAGTGAAALMHAAPAHTWEVYRVDPKVNSNRVEGPGLIAPLAA